MDLMALPRRIANALKVPTTDKYGLVGLQLNPDSKSGGSSADNTHKACHKRRKRHTQAPAKVEARAPQVKIETVLSLVVADGAGRPIAHTAIPVVPSAGTVLNLAGVGPVTVPSLKVQNGKLTAQTAKSPSATRASTASHKPAAAPGDATNSRSATSTRSSSSSATKSAATTSGRNSSSAAPTTLKSSTRSSSSSSSSSSGIVVTSASASRTSGNVFGAAGGAPSSTGAAPAASTTALVDRPVSTQNTPVLVGGVVGSVAGFALLLAVLMAFLKWRRRHKSGVSELKSNPADTPHRPDTGRSDMIEHPGAAMGAAGAITAAGAGRGGNASERSFQRVGGRKLESVLVSGGDGYGEPGSSRNAGNASFFRDSEGTYGAVSQTSSVYTGPRELDTIGTAVIPPVPERKNPGIFRNSPSDSHSPSPPPDLSTSPPDVVLTRPGPARNVVYSPGFQTPPQSPLPRSHDRSPAHRLRQDAVGRSHPSLDGSRDSRGSKFAEDLN